MASKSEVREVARRAYWREAEGRVMVEAWHASGEALASFAHHHGVAPGRISRWAKRLGTPEEEAVQFHPAQLVGGDPEGSPAGAIEIHLPGGVCVCLPPAFEAEDLRRVMAVLGETARC